MFAWVMVVFQKHFESVLTKWQLGYRCHFGCDVQTRFLFSFLLQGSVNFNTTLHFSWGILLSFMPLDIVFYVFYLFFSVFHNVLQIPKQQNTSLSITRSCVCCSPAFISQVVYRPILLFPHPPTNSFLSSWRWGKDEDNSSPEEAQPAGWLL